MRPREAEKVKLFASVFTSDPGISTEVLRRLNERFGPIDILSEPFAFASTGYYSREFGPGLKRRVCSFERLVAQDALAAIKIFTNGIEDTYLNPNGDGARRVNIDPGYVALPRFVLASCKGFSHRIYIGLGVYADLTLRYEGNGYQALPWTYPDYKQPRMLGLITRMRGLYARQTAAGRREMKRNPYDPHDGEDSVARSMTGYGRAEIQLGPETCSIEVKSLNNRFLEVNLRMPERFSALDARIRDEIKKRFSRGSFTINAGMTGANAPALRLNLHSARLYLDAAETLRKELGVTGTVDVNALLKLKEIFTSDRASADAEADWAPLKAGLATALTQLDEWRAKEGAALTHDLLAGLERLEERMGRVQDRVPEVTAAYRGRLKDEMEKLLNGRADESRILLEAAIYAQRSDIAEELARLKSHLTLFRGYAASSEPAGKRLDFLCQEIGREINTIGSKSADVNITADVVEMKAEMEKIREQAQNIE